MHHWTIVDCTYLYDGTMEGLLSVVYTCFQHKKVPEFVAMESEYTANLLDQTRMIATDLHIASDMIHHIQTTISDATLYYIFTAFLSCDKDKSNIILRYIVYAFKYGRNINRMKSLECVIAIQQLCKKVKFEAHRFLGFIRFRELSNTILYAEYASDNDILYMLAMHFSKRLQKETWMIHDIKRNQVALYNRDTFTIVDSSTLDISTIDAGKEDIYLQLWKEYFTNISIKERKNKRCQMQFMPKKYWKYLPEV